MTKVIVATRETSSIPEFAGNTWVPLNYMLGLQRLGIESYWVDRIGPVDPWSGSHSLEYLVTAFQHTACQFGFEDRYCIVYDAGARFFGMDEDKLRSLVSDVDAVLNIGGHMEPNSLLMDVRRRAFVDVDPGFTQIWAHQGKLAIEQHSHFFTVGQNVGKPEFAIPSGNVEWHIIVPPVVLSQWYSTIEERSERFSTIADWRGSQEAIFRETYFGGKREEFIRFLRVPSDAGLWIEIALCIDQRDYEDLGLLLSHNWRVRDPYQCAGDPRSYLEFIQYSRAEFSVAKRGYLRSRSGWISDRTVCYLASGKPAVVQSTGFEDSIPVGEGLLTFGTPEQAVTAIQEVNRNYLQHCHAARRIAEERFNSDIVLSAILERIGL